MCFGKMASKCYLMLLGFKIMLILAIIKIWQYGFYLKHNIAFFSI